jgi:hypothetical protein
VIAVTDVGGYWLGGGDELWSGFDRDGAAAADGSDEFLDAPTPIVLLCSLLLWVSRFDGVVHPARLRRIVHTEVDRHFLSVPLCTNVLHLTETDDFSQVNRLCRVAARDYAAALGNNEGVG